MSALRWKATVRAGHLRVAATVLCLALTHSCTLYDSIFGKDNAEEIRNQNLLILLAAAYLSNPCNRIGPPNAAAGAATSGALIGAGSLRGRVRTTAGAPVVNALVLVEDGNQADSTFFASHSSLSRDGSFEIAGIPVGASYRVSVEPINTAYYSRIETHIDCFLSPATFTYGWYAGNGAGVASSFGAASTVSTTANVRNDIGTLVVSP